jgi:pimeloyl-ACP methyl ester carboxylesterase
MPYATVNGLRTYFDREGGGRPMIMIHGASQDSTSWRYNLPYFSEWYDVLAVDLPGHGKSELPQDTGPVRSVKTYSEHIWGLIQALELRDPIVVGHSLAGAIALRLGVDHSAHLAAVVDVDGAAFTVSQATNYQEGMLDLVSINPTDWLETMFLSVLGRSTPLERKKIMASDARRVAPEVALGDLYAYTGCDFIDEVGDIGVPVIVLVGEDDWSCTPELAHSTFERVTSPKDYHLFETVGHIPHTEQPEIFNETLRGLLVKHGL